MYIEALPKALLDDITSNRCIPFIGSGFSKNCVHDSSISIPDWNELGKKVATYIPNYKYDNAVEALSYYESEYSRPNLVETIAKELHINEIAPGEAHLSFCRLFFDLICTTNFDFLLENSFGELYSSKGKPFHVVTNEARLSTYLNEKTTIIKIHGDFNEPQNMVITENDYDIFISKNPLLSTYIANLLITRTPLLIGYSMNDPDIRMLWNIISSRLQNLRRKGYVLLVDASSSDISRFSRRGFNVINLPGKNTEYKAIFVKLFSEMLYYWNKNTEKEIRTSNEDAAGALKLSEDDLNSLCFLSVPYEKLSLYKKYVFPIIEQHGLIPVSTDEFILPGDNINAKINMLIKKSVIAIVDISSLGAFMSMEIGLINETKIPCLFIATNKSTNTMDIENHRIIIGDFDRDIDKLLNDIEEFVGSFMFYKYNDLANEPQRLYEKREYNAAIIAAIKLLEIKLSQTWFVRSQDEQKYNAPIPLRQLIIKMGSDFDLNVNKIKEWMSIRNKVVHSQFEASKRQAKEIVDGINEIIRSIDRIAF